MKNVLLALAVTIAAATPAAAQNVKEGLTRDKLAANLDRRFRAMDTDGNASVTSAEFTAAAQKRGAEKFKAKRTTKLFTKTDANRDGSLSLDEFKNRALALFDARDANKNGRIDAGEVPATAAAAAAEE